MAKNRIKGITIEIDGNTTQLSNSLKDVNSKLKDTQSALKDVDSLLKMDPGNVELLAQKQQYLTEAIDATKEKLEQEKLALEQMKANNSTGEISEEQRALEREIVETETSLESLESEMKTFGDTGTKEVKSVAQSMEEVGNKVSEAGEKMTAVGDNLTKYVTGPIVAAGAASMAAWTEVDSAMDIVIKKTGAAGDTLEKLGDSVNTIATTVPTSFENAATAVGEVNTRFGVMGDDLTELSTKFIKFAEIADTDLNGSIGSTSRILQQFGLEASDIDQILDALAATGQATGADVGKLMQVIEKNGNVLRNMELGIGDSVALLGSFEQAGIDAQDALSGLSKASINWKRDGKSVTEGLDELIKKLNDGEVTAEDYADAIDVFGTKAADKFVDMASSGRFSLDNLSGDMSQFDGTVSNTFDGIKNPVDNLTTVFNELKITGADIAATMQELLVPALEKINELAKKAKDAWVGLDKSEKEQIVKIAGIAAAIGPLLSVGGRVVSGIGNVITMAPKIGTALTALTGPVGIVVAAIAALTAAFVALWESDEGFRTDISGIFDEIQISIQPLLDALGELWTAFQELMQALWAAFGSDIVQMVKTVIIDGIIPQLQTFIDFIINVVNLVKNLVNGDWTAAWEDLKRIATNLVELTIRTVIIFFEGFMKTSIQIFWKIVAGIGEALLELGASIREKIDEIVYEAIEFWGDLLKQTLEIFQSIWDGIVEKVTGIKDSIVEGVGEAVQFLADLPGKALTWGRDMIENFISGIKEKVGALTEEIAATADEIAAYLGFSEPEKGSLSRFHEFAPDMMDLFAKGIRDNIPKVRKAAEDMAAAVAQPVNASTLTFNIANTINGSPGQNINDLAIAVDRRITTSVAQRRSAWA
jgi:phage-related minor tail protein